MENNLNNPSNTENQEPVSKNNNVVISKKKWVKNVVLITTIVLVIAIGGLYFLGVKNSTSVDDVNTPEETIENSELITCTKETDPSEDCLILMRISWGDTYSFEKYRNEEYEFSTGYQKAYGDIVESSVFKYAKTEKGREATVYFSFKDFKNSSFASIDIYEKNWFYENTKIEEVYNECNIIGRRDYRIVWGKDQKDGYPFGTYLGENNNYVFVFGLSPQSCPAPAPFCSLSSSIRETIQYSFSILEDE